MEAGSRRWLMNRKYQPSKCTRNSLWKYQIRLAEVKPELQMIESNYMNVTNVTCNRIDGHIFHFFFSFFYLVSFCIHNFTIVRAASIQVIRNIRMERRHTVIESWSRRGHANIQTVHYVQVCRWERLQKEHFNRIYRAFPFYGAPIHLWKAPFQFREFSSIRRVAGMVVAVEWWSSSSLFPSDR